MGSKSNPSFPPISPAHQVVNGSGKRELDHRFASGIEGQIRPAPIVAARQIQNRGQTDIRIWGQAKQLTIAPLLA
jgi:hypothetical protein